MKKTIATMMGTLLAVAAVQADPTVSVDFVGGRSATISFAGLDAATTNSLVLAWGDSVGETPEVCPNRLFGGLVRPGDTTCTVTLPETVTGSLRAFLVQGVWDAPTDYVQDGLINRWDGIDNAGTGTHDPSATVWKDMAGTLDLHLTTNGVWNPSGNGLVCTGLSATGTVATAAYQTIEVLFNRHHGAIGNYVFSSGNCSDASVAAPRLVINSGSTAQFAANTHCPVLCVVPETIVAGAATYSGDYIEAIYQDGVRPRQPVTFNESWSSNQKYVMIGGRKDSSYAWKSGEVYTIRLYDRVLSDAEIAANHRLDAVRFFGVPRGSAVLAASAVQSCAKGVEVVSTGFDFEGRPSTATLAFRGVASPCDLVMAWGDSDAGADPASWPNRRDLGVVEPEDETRVIELPAGWSASSHARFFLKSGVDAPQQYVTDGLMTWLDGIDNAGTGTHDPAAQVWTDKAEVMDFTLTNNAVWNAAGNALVCNGVSAIAERPTFGYLTIEAVYRSTCSGGRVIFISNYRKTSGNTWDCSRMLVDGGAAESTYFEGINTLPLQNLAFPYDSRRIHGVAAVYDDNDRALSLFNEGSPVSSSGYYNNWGCGSAGATLGGRSGTDKIYPWYGELHALRLYITRLTAAELLANHRLDLVRFRGVARGNAIAAVSGDLTYAEGTAGAAEEEPREVVAAQDGIRVDLRDGVRVIEWRKQLLPFTYSATCDRDYTDGYVRDGLINWWDGIDNAGVGKHDSYATVWKDKAGTIDLRLTSRGTWNATGNGLTVNGCSATGTVATAAYKTVEATFKIKDSTARILFASGCSAGANSNNQPPRFVLFDHNKDGDGTMRGYFDGAKTTIYATMQRDPAHLYTLTGVYNDNNTVTHVYSDGVEDVSGKTFGNSWGIGDGKAMIGSRDKNSSYPWYGDVFAIRLYDRALTSAEIANNRALDLYRFSGDGSSPADAFAARITLMQVTGEGDDVSAWTDEVPGTAKTLVQSAATGEVAWYPKAGVWKATFDLIFQGNIHFHTETVVFDLRDFHETGTSIVIR